MEWMTLQDLRKFAIQKQVQVRFPLSNAMECVVDRHGVSRVPGLNGALGRSLDEELAQAAWFSIEAGEGERRSEGGVQRGKMGRAELEAQVLSTAGTGAGAASSHSHGDDQEE
jgi:hypothetical protein